ncbi:hypothetical protein AUI51_01075 [archaeon 13_1_40CM_2_52_4]|nr:MAG: hypothetical protein AUI51_01075 [archaeon 13_1_40CM_2_52_4]
MMMDMATKRSLSILLLTLALSISSVAIVHAPSSVTTIRPPVISPTAPTSSDIVTVATNVTSSRSTIKNVTITYTTDNWKSSNTTIVATYNSTSTTAKGQIPALAAGTHVKYYITAFDNVPTKTVNDNNTSYFTYGVSASTSLTSISTITYILVAIAIAAAVATVAIMILKAPQGKSKRAKSTSTQDQDWNRNSSP